MIYHTRNAFKIEYKTSHTSVCINPLGYAIIYVKLGGMQFCGQIRRTTLLDYEMKAWYGHKIYKLPLTAALPAPTGTD